MTINYDANNVIRGHEIDLLVELKRANSGFSWITDLVIFAAFLSFVAPDTRIGWTGFIDAVGVPRLSELLGLMIAVVGLFEWLLSRRRFKLQALHWGCLAYLVATYVFGILLEPEMYYSEYPGGYMHGSVRSGVVIPIAIFLVLSQLEIGDRRLRRLLVLFVVGQLVVAASIMAQQAGLIQAKFHWTEIKSMRLFGFGYNTAHTAYGLSLGVVITIGLIWGQKRFWAYLSWIAVLPPLLISILATMARTALLGLLLAFFAMFMHPRNWAKMALVMLVLVGLVALSSLVWDIQYERILDIGPGNRIGWWISALGVAARNPFGTSIAGYPEPRFNADVVPLNPQNDLFFVLATQGWLAGILLLSVYVMIFREVLRSRRLRSVNSKRWSRCFTGCVAMWVMFGITEISSASYFMNGPLYILMGFCMAHTRSWGENREMVAPALF